MWQETDQGLYKKFTFKDFEEAFVFMRRVAFVATYEDHHPRWTNEYNIVEIWLSSHDAGGKITDKDRKLADAIDKLINGGSEYEIIGE